MENEKQIQNWKKELYKIRRDTETSIDNILFWGGTIGFYLSLFLYIFNLHSNSFIVYTIFLFFICLILNIISYQFSIYSIDKAIMNKPYSFSKRIISIFNITSILTLCFGYFMLIISILK